MFLKSTREKILNNCYDNDYLFIGTRPKMLSSKDLLLGDVLFSNSNTPTSKFIRKYTEGSYSHSAIYIGDNNVMDINKNGGLRIINLQKFINECNYIVVTRVPMLPKRKLKMQSYINELKKESYKYNKKGALLSFFKEFSTLYKRSYFKKYNFLLRSFAIKNFEKNEKKLNYTKYKTYFCSQLVLDIYARSGYYMTEHQNPEKWTPNGLVREGFFRFLGYMNKYNDLSKIAKNDYFLFGHPELLTKEGQDHNDKIRSDFFNEVAIMLKNTEYNKSLAPIVLDGCVYES